MKSRTLKAKSLESKRAKNNLKAFLDSHYHHFNAQEFLHTHADPLIVVTRNRDFKYFDEMALLCALYAYGNANLIVKNLENMPFWILLDSKDSNFIESSFIESSFIESGFIESKSQKLENIESNLCKVIDSIPLEIFPYYRFQTREDTKNAFKILKILIKNGGIKNIFINEYKKNNSVIQGIKALQNEITQIILRQKMSSAGLKFLFGDCNNNTSPLKRYNMFLRWMVRDDSLDFGTWREVSTRDLLLPLDTHTFNITKKLGLCSVKSYNLKAVLEITQNLKKLAPQDPIKYDFALYRIGQLNIDISNFVG